SILLSPLRGGSGLLLNAISIPSLLTVPVPAAVCVVLPAPPVAPVAAGASVRPQPATERQPVITVAATQTQVRVTALPPATIRVRSLGAASAWQPGTCVRPRKSRIGTAS